MLSAYQWRWGINQWQEFLKDKEIPSCAHQGADHGAVRSGRPSAREDRRAGLAGHCLRRSLSCPEVAAQRRETRRSRQLGQETTTALAAILQTGFDDLVGLVSDSAATSDATLKACHDCESRAVLASSIARVWARQRADVSPEEVALAALLAEIGELLLWQFAGNYREKAGRTGLQGRAFGAIDGANHPDTFKR